MPQISPMNWIVIIFLFLLLLFSIKSFLPKFNILVAGEKSTKTTHKKLSW